MSNTPAPSEPLQTLQPVPDEKNLLISTEAEGASCCGGGCCSTS